MCVVQTVGGKWLWGGHRLVSHLPEDVVNIHPSDSRFHALWFYSQEQEKKPTWDLLLKNHSMVGFRDALEKHVSA